MNILRKKVQKLKKHIVFTFYDYLPQRFSENGNQLS